KTREGLVEQAANGTLFLDEIGELDVKLQPKLLRFLETRKARRVGGNAEIQSEVRVLSATNSNLESEIMEGKFRSDLYYRLSEVPQRINSRTPSHPQSFQTAPAQADGRPVALNRKQKLEMARQLLESSGNDLTWVAAQLGIHSTTLYRWRKTKKI